MLSRLMGLFGRPKSNESKPLLSTINTDYSGENKELKEYISRLEWLLNQQKLKLYAGTAAATVVDTALLGGAIYNDINMISSYQSRANDPHCQAYPYRDCNKAGLDDVIIYCVLSLIPLASYSFIYLAHKYFSNNMTNSAESLLPNQAQKKLAEILEEDISGKSIEDILAALKIKLNENLIEEKENPEATKLSIV